jgi:hypothetical protein
MVNMDNDSDEEMALGSSDDVANSMELTAASTTIDPSVIQSRIRQSASLQSEEAAMMKDERGQQPVFPKLSAAQASGNRIEYRRVRCPPHRYSPLREHWEQILTPLVDYLKLQVRVGTGDPTIRSPQITVLVLWGFCMGREDPQIGMCIVLFLELQTLREASMVSGTTWGDQWS